MKTDQELMLVGGSPVFPVLVLAYYFYAKVPQTVEVPYWKQDKRVGPTPSFLLWDLLAPWRPTCHSARRKTEHRKAVVALSRFQFRGWELGMVR